MTTPTTTTSKPALAHYFRKHAISVAPYSSPLTPDQVLGILTKAYSEGPDAPVVTCSVDRPVEGTILVIQVPKQTHPQPLDGYGWMDEEIHSKIKFLTKSQQQVDIHVYTKQGGFVQQATNTTIRLQRYFVPSLDTKYFPRGSEFSLQVLHWTSVPITAKMMVISTHMIRPAKTGATSGRVVMVVGYPVVKAASGAPVVLTGNMRNVMVDPKAFLPPGSVSLAQGVAIQAQGDQVVELNGGVLDNLNSRDIALTRYKRNHEFLEEVFSLYPTKTIEPPKRLHIDLSPETTQRLTQRKTQIESEMQKLKDAHTKKLEDSKRQREAFEKQYEALMNCDGDSDRVLKEFLNAREKSEGAKLVVVKEAVKKVSGEKWVPPSHKTGGNGSGRRSPSPSGRGQAVPMEM